MQFDQSKQRELTTLLGSAAMRPVAARSANSLQRLRRATTQLAIRQTIMATARLPIGPQRSFVRSLVALGGGFPMLRRRVRENMHLALGQDVPAHSESLYFRHLGWFLSSSLSTFHYGVAATPVLDEVELDDSVGLLDDAVAEGRGVVLTAPHWSGHELVAAIVSQRHPMVPLVRRAPTLERTARKLKWYNALGMETVLWTSRVSSIKDAVAYLRVLKRGKLLGITPDLLTEPGKGVETCIFGRPARLHGGAFAIAISARVPMIRMSLRWQSDSRVVVMFDRAPLTLDSCDRDAAIRAGMQDWCRWFEEKLRANPENWLFWLDKRWSRFLRATPRVSAAE
jgi:lauroyl/myristoyl acyltransferase